MAPHDLTVFGLTGSDFLVLLDVILGVGAVGVLLSGNRIIRHLGTGRVVEHANELVDMM